MGDGQDQLLTDGEQMLGPGVGCFKLFAVSAGLAQVAPDEQQEKDSQQKGTACCSGQREGCLAADFSCVGCACVAETACLVLHVADEACHGVGRVDVAHEGVD